MALEKLIMYCDTLDKLILDVTLVKTIAGGLWLLKKPILHQIILNLESTTLYNRFSQNDSS